MRAENAQGGTGAGRVAEWQDQRKPGPRTRVRRTRCAARRRQFDSYERLSTSGKPSRREGRAPAQERGASAGPGRKHRDCGARREGRKAAHGTHGSRRARRAVANRGGTAMAFRQGAWPSTARDCRASTFRMAARTLQGRGPGALRERRGSLPTPLTLSCASARRLRARPP